MQDTKKIIDIITSYSGEDIDLCYYAVDIIKESENPVLELISFFENIGVKKSDESLKLEKHYENEELENINKMYSTYIMGFLSALVERAHIERWGKETFYSHLWENLIHDFMLENSKLQAFALLRYAQNDLMPYVEIGKPISMDSDEFSRALEQNVETIKKIQHIVAMNFTQKTEVSSLILEEICKIKKKEDQIVTFAVALDLVTKSKLNGLMKVLKESGIKVEEK
ncbi:MAG: hypothetical protein PHD56_08695 [Anaerostipes sp.]|nr:hypothetical protein [Anaerostipes sp.]